MPDWLLKLLTDRRLNTPTLVAKAAEFVDVNGMDEQDLDDDDNWNELADHFQRKFLKTNQTKRDTNNGSRVAATCVLRPLWSWFG